VARWLTPKHRQINETGLTPDVIVELTQADVDAGIDTQLNKAIEILSQAE
jgi:carboxyl-terminal processing protease